MSGPSCQAGVDESIATLPASVLSRSGDCGKPEDVTLGVGVCEGVREVEAVCEGVCEGVGEFDGVRENDAVCEGVRDRV